MHNSTFLFRHMPVGNYDLISKKMYDFVLNHTTILDTKSPRDDWGHWYNINLDEFKSACPELVEYFTLINLEMKFAVMIYTPAGVQGMIHVDGSTRDDHLPFRCLWPVKNCEGSFTKFFEVDPDNIVDKFISSGYVYREVTGPVTEIGAVELTTPVIFNPNIAHGVFTNPKCTDGRISLTIGFYNTNEELLNI